MRIVIDLQGAQTESRFRGIGRYSLSLAKAMVRNCGNHEIIIALNGIFSDTIEPIRAEFDDLLPQKNIRVWYSPGPVRECKPGNTWHREVAELIREAFLASLQPDVVHIMSLFEGYVDDAVTSLECLDKTTPVSVSLYDLIPLLNSGHYLKSNPAYEQYYLRKIDHLQRSSLLLAISESSRQEGIVHLGQHNDSIVNISAAADDHFRPLLLAGEQAQILRYKFGLSRPFVLYTGGADKRKNLPRLIRVYAQLSAELRNAHQLVFSGNMPEGDIHQLKQKAKAAGLYTDELIFTGHVTDDELVKLYNLCKLHVLPSWHEGFGLPALEAMACGTPVIAADISSLPEVMGRKYAMFDPFDEISIAEKITQVLTDDEFRQRLIDDGRQQATKFSWDKSANRAIQMFERIHEKSISSGHAELSMAGLEHRFLINRIADIEGSDFSDHDLISVAAAISKNHPADLKKKLFVDISELVQRDAKSGVQRVVRNVLKELNENQTNECLVEAVYATMQSTGYRYARKFMTQFLDVPQETADDEFIEPQPGDIFLGLDLQHHVVQRQASVYSQFRQIGVHVYFVVYDLLPILLPQAFVAGTESMHTRWLGIVAQSDGAICISRAVGDEVAIWMKEHGPQRLRPFSIDWFHLGADIDNSMPTRGMSAGASEVLSILAKRQSFLMVGTIEPRKAHAQTLAAFESLWENHVDVNLVIVGKQGWMVEQLVARIKQHSELGKHLFWLAGISDEYLDKLYDVSTCLIAASEGEGFGLPLIEAAQHKMPIIARDIPVFHEVVGKHAFYFSGLEPKSLAQAVQEWLALFESQQHPTSVAMQWQTWAESAGQLLDVMGISNQEKQRGQVY